MKYSSDMIVFSIFLSFSILRKTVVAISLSERSRYINFSNCVSNKSFVASNHTVNFYVKSNNTTWGWVVHGVSASQRAVGCSVIVKSRKPWATNLFLYKNKLLILLHFLLMPTKECKLTLSRITICWSDVPRAQGCCRRYTTRCSPTHLTALGLA